MCIKNILFCDILTVNVLGKKRTYVKFLLAESKDQIKNHKNYIETYKLRSMISLNSL